MSRFSVALSVLALSCLCSCTTVDLTRLSSDVRRSFQCDTCDTPPVAGYRYRDIPVIPENTEMIVVYRDSMQQRVFLHSSFGRSTPSMPQEADSSRERAASFLRKAQELPSFSLFHGAAPEEIIGDPMFTGSLQFYRSYDDNAVSMPIRDVEAMIPYDQVDPDQPMSGGRYRKSDPLASVGAVFGVVGGILLILVAVAFITWDGTF